MKEIYWIIKRKMSDNNITQTELGEKIGVTQATISAILRRLRTGKGIQANNLERILSALNLEIKIEEVE